MKFGLAIVAALMLGIAAVQVYSAPPSSEKNDIGRYQIVQGHIDATNTVFRIDTSTGRTWEYINVAGPKPLNGWVPIPEPSGLPNSH